MIGERHIGRPRPADRPDAARCCAETAGVLCGKYSSTPRKVQSGAPHDTAPPSAAGRPETERALRRLHARTTGLPPEGKKRADKKK